MNDNEKRLAVGKNEDVEFSEALADQEDRKAFERADAAEKRQERN